ncbi:MAG: DUF5947 family protein [Candidatus Eremiobacteraeota bacterium]|nr:DUF5947 family protein [Candidatus Eremiobacteraeota bacterium]
MDIIARILNDKTPKSVPEEQCDLCARPIGETHSHLVDLKDRRLMCACRPCYLVFQPKGAAQGRYKTVPERYVWLQDLALPNSTWDQFQIPIGLAFFFFNSTEKKTMAFYPGPAGAMESLLPLDAWNELVAMRPELATMEPDVEAFMLRRERNGPEQYFIVPIDKCYELVGSIKLCWKGFDGGDEARAKIDGFFAELMERSEGSHLSDMSRT